MVNTEEGQDNGVIVPHSSLTAVFCTQT